MRLRATYTLSFLADLPLGFESQLRIDLEGKTFHITEWDETQRRATATIEAPVNCEGLSLRTGQKPLGGGIPRKGISVPERLDVGRFVPRIVHLLSFLTDVPIRYSHKLEGDSLLPESAEDKDLLESFETRQLHESLSATVSIRSFSLPRVDDQTLDALARKEAGMALYAEALLLQEPIGTFREFWKVLESAFAAKDAQLIRCLSEYTPAEQLGFTQTELRGLHTLRGRASHAESRYGLDEHESVLAETSSRLARLKCLAEQVILTKKTWGVRTTECERLAPVSAFIDANGGEVLIRPADPTEEGNRRGN